MTKEIWKDVVRQCSIYGSCSGRYGLIKGYFWRYYKVDNLFNKV